MPSHATSVSDRASRAYGPSWAKEGGAGIYTTVYISIYIAFTSVYIGAVYSVNAIATAVYIGVYIAFAGWSQNGPIYRGTGHLHLHLHPVYIVGYISGLPLKGERPPETIAAKQKAPKARRAA